MFTLRAVLSTPDWRYTTPCSCCGAPYRPSAWCLAASMATVLLCAGARGKRYALPNATIHLHQALGGAQGQAADIEIAAREIMRLQEKIRDILAQHTGQTVEKISHDTDRDFYLDPYQAKEYGLIDEILTKPEKK